MLSESDNVAYPGLLSGVLSIAVMLSFSLKLPENARYTFYVSAIVRAFSCATLQADNGDLKDVLLHKTIEGLQIALKSPAAGNVSSGTREAKVAAINHQAEQGAEGSELGTHVLKTILQAVQ